MMTMTMMMMMVPTTATEIIVVGIGAVVRIRDEPVVVGVYVLVPPEVITIIAIAALAT